MDIKRQTLVGKRGGGWRGRLAAGLSHALGATSVVIAMGIAAIYGIGPVQAATPEVSSAVDAAPTEAGGLDAVSVSPLIANDPLMLNGITEAPAPQATSDEPVGPDPGKGYRRVGGHMVEALQQAAVVGESDRSRFLTLTLVMNRNDQAGFDRYLKEVYDPQSPRYRHFFTPAQIAERFGPTARAYGRVAHYLRQQGLQVTTRSHNRMTLTVRGTRGSVERAFRIRINDYAMGKSTFYANDTDPALPDSIATTVEAISGLSDLSRPQPARQWAYVKCGGSASGANGGSKSAARCINTVNALINLAQTIYCLAVGVLVSFYGGVGAYAATSSYAGAAAGTGAALARAGAAAAGGAAANNFSGFACPFLVIPAWNAVMSAANGNSPGGNSVKSLGFHSNPNAANTNGSGTTTVNAADGSGQSIGLLEFDGFYTSDVSDYLALFYAPSSIIDNLTVKPVNGGVTTPGSGESEVLLDVDTVMSFAPGAKVIVYEAPFTGQAASYAAMFNAMINDGVTIISNSWASCEDQISAAEAQSIDSILQTAAASGISVFNASGDGGSTCLDGSANTISVPADSPNATAVGGTSLANPGSGPLYSGETWWDGSASVPATGQGGFGVSKFFSRPSYQNGLNAGSMRSIPDVAIVADPADGPMLCEADNGGCPNGTLNGGTSIAAPEWAALTALLNQAQGKNLGAMNPVLYPLAATDAFNNAASMASDFPHVGLGSPNVNAIRRLLSNQTVGVPSATLSEVVPLGQPGNALVNPAGLTGGTNTAFATPADGTSQGGILVTLFDANGNTVSGKTVTLTANSTHAVIASASGVSNVNNGSVVFSVTDLTAETVTFTATDTTDGIVLPTITLNFGVPNAASGGITANPPTVPADGQTPTTVIVTLTDSLSRPTPGKTVTLADGGAHAVVTGPTPSVTDANGQIQFSVTDQVNESVTFSAVDVTDGDLAIPGSATVTFNGSATTACGAGLAPVAGTGYTVTPFITGFPSAATFYYAGANIGCPSGNYPAFTSAGTVLASDFLNGGIYQTGLAGGAVSTANLVNTLTPALGPLVYGKDGNVYATLGNQGAEIVQVDPTTGAQVRVVASGLTCPAGLSVDPLSGDLFFDDQCTGGGTDNASIFRVIDPANTNAGAPTSVVTYATLPATPNGGMAFAPDGTLYAVSGYYIAPNAPIEQISGTNAATVTVTPVTGITSAYAVAVGATNADGSAQSLIVTASSGAMSEISVTNPSTATVLISANSPNVGVTGPDGCLYASGYGIVYKITGSNGTCNAAPTSPAPSINLTPAMVTPNAAQGASQTFTATLKNVTPLSGVPVTFHVSGANGQVKLATTNAQGTAVISYTGMEPGTDSVVATAVENTTTLTSNLAQVDWTAGQHVTFLSLNTSPAGGTVNQAFSASASLTDVSANPVTSIAGQSITLTLGSSSCTATTNASGVATCTLTPSGAGSATLSATFAGNSTLAAAKTSTGFTVSYGPAAPPTVSLSVSPASIAAGTSATLTWSSTNATACTASGAWSGTEAATGSQTVTPGVVGTYSYVLTCAGNGGSASATAVLSATLVAVTVSAKSGGGAISWSLLLLLGLLVALRWRAILSSRFFAATMLCVAVLMTAAGSGSARADQFAADTPVDWTDSLYVGIRVGDMPVRVESAKLDQGLASLGYGGVNAVADTSGPAGTVFLGYDFTPHAGLEFAYTYRDATVAQLHGTIASAANLTPLLQDTTELLRSYGNILSMSYTGHFEIAPRFSIEPRLGGFFWATKDTAVGFGDRIDATHEGGGVTLGLTAAYRVWRKLELGVAIDHYRGFPNNIATFYGGTMEWRFGR